MSSIVTLATIRTQARERADQVNSNFISTTELDDYINEGILEYYDLMTTHYKEEYYHTRRLLPIGAAASVYELPHDFYKLKGMDIQQSSTDTRYVSMFPYTFNERNRYAYNSSSLPSRNVRIRYVPRAKRLTDTAKTFVDSDVSVSNDTITEADHELFTGQKITLSTTGVLPGGLALLTNYFIITVDADTFKLATNLGNALETETAIDITTAAGGGTHTINGNSDRFDFVNGYETFPLWNAVSMMQQKEEDDNSVAEGHLERMRQRIIKAGPNRDAGSPERITDTDNVNDIELRLYKETNIRYRIMGDNIEFIYVGYLGV